MSKILRKLKVEFRVAVTEEDVDDIMVSALEGGITYWCDEARVVEDKRCANWGHEQIARGGELLIHLIEPFDENDTEWYSLTLDKFMAGLMLWLDLDTIAVCSGDSDSLHLDTGEIDACGADCIIQLALFGEVVFV